MVAPSGCGMAWSGGPGRGSFVALNIGLARWPAETGGGGASDVELCPARPRVVPHGHRSTQRDRMPTPTPWRGRPVPVVAVALALTATPPVFAVSGSHSRFVSPGGW